APPVHGVFPPPAPPHPAVRRRRVSRRPGDRPARAAEPLDGLLPRDPRDPGVHPRVRAGLRAGGRRVPGLVRVRLHGEDARGDAEPERVLPPLHAADVRVRPAPHAALPEPEHRGEQRSGGHGHIEPASSPRAIRVRIDEGLERRRLGVLARLILAIPHILWLYVFTIAAALFLVAGWFAALATGRLPRGIHDFLGAWMRYSTWVWA